MSTQVKALGFGFGVFALLLGPSLAQTAQQLGTRFTTVNAYQGGPGSRMLTKFDARGEICEALIEPVKEGTSKADRISEKVADEVIEQVVPLKSRGRSQGPYLDPDSTVAGGVYKLKSNFEFVSIEKMGNVPTSDRDDKIQVIRITWTKRTCIESR